MRFDKQVRGHDALQHGFISPYRDASCVSKCVQHCRRARLQVTQLPCSCSLAPVASCHQPIVDCLSNCKSAGARMDKLGTRGGLMAR